VSFCVATAVLWLRSYFVADHWFRHAGMITSVCSSGGWVEVERFEPTE
jgi:hypothetical protein